MPFASYSVAVLEVEMMRPLGSEFGEYANASLLQGFLDTAVTGQQHPSCITYESRGAAISSMRSCCNPDLWTSAKFATTRRRRHALSHTALKHELPAEQHAMKAYTSCRVLATSIFKGQRKRRARKKHQKPHTERLRSRHQGLIVRLRTATTFTLALLGSIV